MTDTYYLQENRIEEALKSYASVSYKSAAACATHFGIKPRTLQRRLNGGGSYSSRGPSHKALTNEQETALIQYLRFLDGLNLSPSVRVVREAANHLLVTASQKSDIDPSLPPKGVSSSWATRFLARNQDLYSKKQQPLAAEYRDAQARHSTIDEIDPLEPQTPRLATDLIDYGTILQRRLKNEESITPVELQRFIKESIANAALSTLITRDIEAIHHASIAKAAGKRLEETVASQREVIAVEDVRGNYIESTKKELERSKKG